MVKLPTTTTTDTPPPVGLEKRFVAWVFLFHFGVWFWLFGVVLVGSGHEFWGSRPVSRQLRSQPHLSVTGKTRQHALCLPPCPTTLPTCLVACPACSMLPLALPSSLATTFPVCLALCPASHLPTFLMLCHTFPATTLTPCSVLPCHRLAMHACHACAAGRHLPFALALPSSCPQAPPPPLSLFSHASCLYILVCVCHVSV